MADFGLSTLLVAVVVMAVTVAVAWRRPFPALAFLVLAIPLRDFSTRWMNVHTPLSVPQVTAIGRWWFALILALLAVCGIRWVMRIRAAGRLPRMESADIMLAAAVGLAALAALTSANRSAAFLSLRGYLQPLGVFLLARLIMPSRRELRALLVTWLAVGAIMAALGLWQAVGWEEADFRAQGYIRQDGDLVVPYAYVGGQRYLRPASTVSGPNELGMGMVLLFAMAGLSAIFGPRRARLPLAGLSLLFIAGMAVSLSRSAFLGWVAALIAGVFLFRGGLARLWRSATGKRRAAFIAASALGLAAAVLVLAATPLLQLVRHTVSSFTQQYHFVDSARAVEYLLQHPEGVGMGLVEPKGALALIEAGGLYHVEGSIFQIAMEMGVWGLVAWLAFWAAALAQTARHWAGLQSDELRVVAGTAFAAWLGGLVAFLFLPLMQSISLMVWLWFLLGAGCQSSAWEAAWAAVPQAGEIATAGARSSADVAAAVPGSPSPQTAGAQPAGPDGTPI